MTGLRSPLRSPGHEAGRCRAMHITRATAYTPTPACNSGSSPHHCRTLHTGAATSLASCDSARTCPARSSQTDTNPLPSRVHYVSGCLCNVGVFCFRFISTRCCQEQSHRPSRVLIRLSCFVDHCRTCTSMNFPFIINLAQGAIIRGRTKKHFHSLCVIGFYMVIAELSFIRFSRR